MRRFSEEKIDPRFAKQIMKQCWEVAIDMFDVHVRSSAVFLLQFRKTWDYIKLRERGKTWMNGVYTIVKSRKEWKNIEKERYNEYLFGWLWPIFRQTSSAMFSPMWRASYGFQSI